MLKDKLNIVQVSSKKPAKEVNDFLVRATIIK